MFSITLLDIILFPVYCGLFYLLLKYYRKKISDPLLQLYLTRGFLIRIIGTIAFTVFNTYFSPGDSIGVFFPEGVNLYHMVLKDPSLLGKMFFVPADSIDNSLLVEPGNSSIFSTESNYMVVRISALFSFLSFGSYFITNLFFSMLSFVGMWRLYKFFYALIPKLHKELAIAIFYFPTVIFWSSGVFKDPICIAGIGFITYSFYKVLYSKEAFFVNILIILFFGFLLINLKIYILLAYLPCLILFVVFKNIALIKNTFIKVMIGPALLIITILSIIIGLDNYKKELGIYAADEIVENVKRQQTNFEMQQEYANSNFDLGTQFDGSLSGFIKLIPYAITATLFRPFIWESNKFSTLLSSIESLTLMLFTLFVFYKAGIIGFFRAMFNNSVALYCFSFAMIFGIFVGASTLNFGSLVRYKIPCLPFYLIALFIVLDIAKKKNRKINPLI